MKSCNFVDFGNFCFNPKQKFRLNELEFLRPKSLEKKKQIGFEKITQNCNFFRCMRINSSIRDGDEMKKRLLTQFKSSLDVLDRSKRTIRFNYTQRYTM